VLATDPELVMLDEPTAGMSTEETQDTMDLIDDVLSDQSLMLIEHDIDLVMRVSDNITGADSRPGARERRRRKLQRTRTSETRTSEVHAMSDPPLSIQGSAPGTT